MSSSSSLFRNVDDVVTLLNRAEEEDDDDDDEEEKEDGCDDNHYLNTDTNHNHTTTDGCFEVVQQVSVWGCEIPSDRTYLSSLHRHTGWTIDGSEYATRPSRIHVEQRNQDWIQIFQTYRQDYYEYNHEYDDDNDNHHHPPHDPNHHTTTPSSSTMGGTPTTRNVMIGRVQMYDYLSNSLFGMKMRPYTGDIHPVFVNLLKELGEETRTKQKKSSSSFNDDDNDEDGSCCPWLEMDWNRNSNLLSSCNNNNNTKSLSSNTTTNNHNNITNHHPVTWSPSNRMIKFTPNRYPYRIMPPPSSSDDEDENEDTTTNSRRRRMEWDPTVHHWILWYWHDERHHPLAPNISSDEINRDVRHELKNLFVNRMMVSSSDHAEPQAEEEEGEKPKKHNHNQRKKKQHIWIQYVWYRNPSPSVPDLFHVQVFWRKGIRTRSNSS